MSPPYRIEREPMASGQTMALYRIIVRLGRGWGTVQAGLDRPAADALLEQLLKNESERNLRLIRPGYRR